MVWRILRFFIFKIRTCLWLHIHLSVVNFSYFFLLWSLHTLFLCFKYLDSTIFLRVYFGSALYYAFIFKSLTTLALLTLIPVHLVYIHSYCFLASSKFPFIYQILYRLYLQGFSFGSTNLTVYLQKPFGFDLLTNQI